MAHSKTMRRLACLAMAMTTAVFVLTVNYRASHKGTIPSGPQLLYWIGTSGGIVVGCF
jgi:hypothetical protein